MKSNQLKVSTRLTPLNQQKGNSAFGMLDADTALNTHEILVHNTFNGTPGQPSIGEGVNSKLVYNNFNHQRTKTSHAGARPGK